MTERPALMTVSDAAAKQVQALLSNRGKPSVGIRIGISTKGCSGMSYTIEYADEKDLLMRCLKIRVLLF